MNHSEPSELQGGNREDLVSLASGSGIVMFGLFTRVLLVFATEVIAARILLADRYGLITWGLFLLNMLCMLAGFGLNTAIRRLLPIYQSRNDSSSARGIVILSGMLSLIGGCLYGLLLFIGAGWLAVTVMGDERETVILLTFVLALPLWSIQKAMLSVFNGFKIPKYKVLIEDLLVPGGFLIVILIALVMGWKELAIARGYLCVYFISAILSMVLVRTQTPYKEMVDVVPNYRAIETLKISWPFILAEPLGKSTTGLIDIIIIGILASTQEVGIYRVASDLAVTMSIILMCFGFMYLPIVAEYFDRRKFVEFKEMSARIARWSMQITFPLFAVFFFFPNEVISIFYGKAYLAAAPVLRILAVGYFGHTMVGCTGLNLVAAGMSKSLLLANLFGLIICISANTLFISLWGIKGAALASVMSLWTFNAICLIVMHRKFSIHPFTRLYIQNLSVLLLFACAGSYLIKMGSFFADVSSLILFILICLGIMGVLWAKGYLIDELDQSIIRSLIKKLFPSLQHHRYH